MRKLIFYLFAILMFFVPLVLWPYTSEVFEFNKIVLVYILSTLIASAWAIRCIREGKIIFRRTMLDIPLLIFLGSQIVSTIFSIDFYTSVFGYYSRFNGGLLSIICYSLLYWAFVSNFEKDDTLKLIKIWLASGVLVTTYGVLEHFGIDKDVWVQDVQSRVFSSLGQPNWLAAWLTALIPIAWALLIKSKVKSLSFWGYFVISILFSWTLIFTKSRSGLLGFAVASIVFWTFYLWQERKNIKSILSPLLIIGFSFLAIGLISGTQFTPSINELLNKSKIQQVAKPQGTALETGGTESGTIRKIVWQGALQVWLHYPIFGTGVETFAYSYYLYRPAAHNLTSEWDFIYNKAHNEFLNFAATTGTVGLLSYLTLLGFFGFVILKTKGENKTLNFAIFAGFVSLSVSNFFGFSVVPTQLELFLFPAVAFAVAKIEEGKSKNVTQLDSSQKITISILLIFTFCLLTLISRYWYADVLYSKAHALNSVPRPDLAIPAITKAVKLAPSQAMYYGEMANSYTAVALAYNQAKDASSTAEFTNCSALAIQKAVSLAPANINLWRSAFSVYIRLSIVDEKYLNDARDMLLTAIKLAPTDAKLFYNLGITQANLGDYKSASETLKTAVDLKANYTDARIEYAALLVHLGNNNEAKNQLNYILANLDPKNQTAIQALANIK
ncbi:MAG TPA: O-antigen ligase family protein [Patescibacteria group bacterium]|nr:O-antigen ligase family protein [Patescibacteria group bacterium]